METPGTVAGTRAQGTEQSAAIVDEAALTRKRPATLQARCDDGRPEYIVSRWALTKSFRTMDEIEGWLPRVEGRAP